MSEAKNYLSKEKREELKQELKHLKDVRRKEVAEKLEFAKSLGDLSENAEYHEARQDQAELEDRIMQIEALLQSAEVAPESKKGIVGIGSKVTVKKGKDTAAYIIVGAEEVNIAEKKISYKSPIGAALIGKKKGDTVVYQTPVGSVTSTVLEVE
jgi:transcription elongation factor GreA